ncbi:MAG TPA: hypothetical protein VHT51_10525 [Micropepsaceae bacterium]|jgi:hypothetical protein|nr:hypothetical protein [Micropepsaceae bacterium]
MIWDDFDLHPDQEDEAHKTLLTPLLDALADSARYLVNLKWREIELLAAELNTHGSIEGSRAAAVLSGQ